MILYPKNAKLVALSYFTVLSVVNLIWSIYQGQPFGFDLIILGLTLATIFANSKLLYLVIGSIGVLASLYLGISCLIYQVNGFSNGSNLSFASGYLLTASSFTCSLLLIYAGVKYPVTTLRHPGSYL